MSFACATNYRSISIRFNRRTGNVVFLRRRLREQRITRDLKSKIIRLAQKALSIKLDAQIFKCNEVMADIKQSAALSSTEEESFNGCTELEKMTGFIVVKVTDTNLLADLSSKMTSLHIYQNEMKNIRLDRLALLPWDLGCQSGVMIWF